MIRCREKISYEIERYPEFCKECPCFYTTQYANMNERGTVAHCKLGYMNRQDTRDFSGTKKFPYCQIESDKRVTRVTGGWPQ